MCLLDLPTHLTANFGIKRARTRTRAHTPSARATLRGAGLYHFPNHDGRRGGHLPHVPRVQRHGDRGLASEALRTRSEPRGPDAVGSSRRFAFGPAPRRAGGVLPRARTGGGVSPSIAGGPLVSAGPRVSPYVEAQRTRKGGPGRSASGGAGGGGSPGRRERAPGEAGRQGLRGVVAAPFPSEPLAPRLSPRPEPSRRRSEYSQRARPRRCRRFQSRLLIIDTDIIFSPMNKDLAVAIRTALPRPNAAR